MLCERMDDSVAQLHPTGRSCRCAGDVAAGEAQWDLVSPAPGIFSRNVDPPSHLAIKEGQVLTASATG